MYARFQERSGRHHALACFHQRRGRHDEALALWAEILKGGKRDQTFPGFDFFVNALLQ
jgi:hypothetical protein